MLEKLKKEIQSTLDQENLNEKRFPLDDNQRGWIEALEYCIKKIELLEKDDKWEEVPNEDIWYWKPGFTTMLDVEKVKNRLFRRIIRQKKWKLVKRREDKND